ncbi:hypothetical protein SpCBS45565_g05230 [Spizellomyces sp. 'palustris']|nr:hypothetical protein SpCBS45565_g05230 [Spizellomyces sp. 'palustris']
MPSTMYQQYPHDNDDLENDDDDDPDAQFAYLKDVLAGTIDPPVDTHWIEKSHAMHSVDVLLEQIDSAIRDLNTGIDDDGQEEEQAELERRLTATSTRSAPRASLYQRPRYASGETAAAVPSEGLERTGGDAPTAIWDHKRAHSAPAPAPSPRLVVDATTTKSDSVVVASSSSSALSSFDDPLILHVGYLRKLTHSRPLGSKTYRPRFLVLTSTHLYLFRSSNPQEASITALPITPTTAAYVSESGLWVLHVQSQGMDEAGAFVTRNWSLQCADKEEMVGWLAALRSAIERRRMLLKSTSDKVPGLQVLSQHGRGILLQELSHSYSTRPVAAFGQPATLFGSGYGQPGYGQPGYGGPPSAPGSNPDLSPALAILEGLERLHSPTTPNTNSTEPRDYFSIPITTEPSTSSSRDDASISSRDTPIETKKEKKAREKKEKKEKTKPKKKDEGLSFGAAMSMVI